MTGPADDTLRARCSLAFIDAYESRRGPRCYTVDQFLAAFWQRTERDGECLLRTTSISSATGYSAASVLGRQMPAHRIAYWIATGIEPPRGMQIDHLCRRRACIEPTHLELVTPEENNRRSTSPSAMQMRQTHCKRGHEFSPENTRIDSRGGRNCRTCHRERIRRIYRRYPCPVCGELRADVRHHLFAIHGIEDAA